ncbi:MAG: hypothetical protein LBJ01_02785 [Tannerella sp.]|jgi:hypothetical protein|nr:hypothetical protein [Tannerella sp.]
MNGGTADNCRGIPSRLGPYAGSKRDLAPYGLSRQGPYVGRKHAPHTITRPGRDGMWTENATDITFRPCRDGWCSS